MPILRLAYVALFLIALVAVFVLWSEVAGQDHLDLMPWYGKLVLGTGAAFAAVKATAAAVAEKQAWNRRSRRWLAVALALLTVCGLATYYCHLYFEDEDQQDDQPNPSVAAASGYNSARLHSALRLARSAPTSATTMRSRS